MGILLRDKSSIFGLNTDLQTLQAADATEKNRAEAVELALQNELDSTQTGAGLGTDGGYTANGAANYISAATSLVNADDVLDAALKAEEVRALAAEGVNAAAISAEESRATAAEGVLSGRLDVVEGDDTTEGSIAKALKDSKDYTDGEIATANGAIGAVEDRLDTLEGDVTVEGSVAKSVDDRINALVDSAPAALDTLKEIADYIDVSPHTDVLEAITDTVTAAKDELKGAVSESFDTLEEVENALDIINGSDTTEGSIAKSLADAKVYADGLDSAMDTRVSATESDIGNLSSLTTTAQGDLVAAINEVNGEADQNASDLSALDTASMKKASNLSDLADKAASRTNLDVYSKGETDAAITAGGATPILESVVVTSGAITLTYAPKAGINGIMNFATVRYVDGNGVAFDAPVLATGDSKVFNVSTDTSGQWDGNTVIVQYVYSL